MAKRELPDQETLRKLIDYDPETGAMTWRARPDYMFEGRMRPAKHCAGIWNSRYAGKPALASTSINGYHYGAIDNRRIYAHRVAYKWVTGIDPIDVDHIDGNRTNNRFVNLRNCTRQENLRNMRLGPRNTSGVMGVDRYRGKWRARIGFDHIGAFDTKEDAATARKAAEMAGGYHPNHGRQ